MLLIKKGRVVNPSTNLNEVMDILIDDGRIINMDNDIDANQYEVEEIIDARNLLVMPGIVDVHVHLREPGFEYKETIESGTHAAVKGGVTTVACMPNTKPAIHSKEVVEYIKEKAKEADNCNVEVVGAITMNIAGESLAPIEELMAAGIVGISDDGRTTMNDDYMFEAFKIAKKYKLPLVSHAEDHNVTQGACMNKSEKSDAFGVKGMPTTAESDIVKRDIDICQRAESKLHIAHVSAAESLEHIKRARNEGISVTCEVGPHHFILDDSIIDVNDASSKVNPPIRSKKDMESMVAGIIDGTVDAIATDHAPHDVESKSKGFEKSAFGISGIETSFALSYTELVKNNKITMDRLISLMSTNPAEILGLDKGKLEVGKVADIAIIDLEASYIIDSSKFISKGKNTPFNGRQVYGVVQYTLVNGKIVYKEA